MSSLTEEQAKAHIIKLLTAMSKAGGSDLFVSKDFPPSMKLQGTMRPLTSQKLTGGIARNLANSLMNQRQRDAFAKDLECNFAISVPGGIILKLGGAASVLVFCAFVFAAFSSAFVSWFD